jgi:hypothetical protein
MGEDHTSSGTDSSQFHLFETVPQFDLAPAISRQHRADKYSTTALHIGYIPSVFVFFPLPYRDPGQKFSKTIRNYRIDLFSRIGIPYGKMGRAVLSLITTQAVCTASPHIELGSLRSTLRKMNVSVYGGKNGSSRRVTEQFHRIANTHIDLDRPVSGPTFKGIDELHFSFAVSLSLRWHSINHEKPLPPASTDNCLELSPDCFGYVISHAVPLPLEPFMQIQSPREQDLLVWLSRRLRYLNEETLVRWDSLYEQFGPVSRTARPSFRIELCDYLFDIRTEIYRHANVSMIDEGLILRPSPPLIERDAKNVGHVL